MKTLTKAEEEIMQALWRIGGAFLKDINNEMPEPKPHPNTVATILKILVAKEFVGIQVFVRMHRYHPLVEKEIYSNGQVKSLVKRYYEGSFSNIVSSMVKENSLSIEELEMLIKKLKRGKEGIIEITTKNKNGNVTIVHTDVKTIYGSASI